MPLISIRFVEKPRKPRRCEECDKPIAGPLYRLFGYAERGDTPFPIFICAPCFHVIDARSADVAATRISGPTQRETS